MYNKFENSEVFSRLFKGDMAIPFRNERKVVATPAQVTTLFSSPLEVAPAVPGYVYYPSFLAISKPAGGTYTTGAAAGIGLYWKTGGAGTSAISFAAATALNLVLAVNGAGIAFADNKQGANGGSIYGGIISSVFYNVGLELRVTTADLTAGSPAVPVTFFFEYLLIPISIPPF